MFIVDFCVYYCIISNGIVVCDYLLKHILFIDFNRFVRLKCLFFFYIFCKKALLATSFYVNGKCFIRIHALITDHIQTFADKKLFCISIEDLNAFFVFILNKRTTFVTKTTQYEYNVVFKTFRTITVIHYIFY